MDFQDYNKTFKEMYKDYFKLNDLISQLRIIKVETFLGNNTKEKESNNLVKEYQVLQLKTLARISKLKEYFVENNKEFNYMNFRVSLSFFNGYSIMENNPIMTLNDYKKVDSNFLNQYKGELVKMLMLKEEQYKILDNLLVADKKQYFKMFNEDIENSKNTDSKAKTIIARYNKIYIQSQNILLKVNSAKSEIGVIDKVLEESNIKTL